MYNKQVQLYSTVYKYANYIWLHKLQMQNLGEPAAVLTVSLFSLNLLAYCLCTTQPTDRTFTSITSLCLPPQAAQNNLSLSSHYSPISSNSVTLPYKGAGTGLKQDRMRKTRCDREEGFTKDRKHRDMSKSTGGRDGGRDK